MTPFELGRVIWEARVKAAWGAYAPTIMARTPWPEHVADTNIAAEHQLCIVQARAAIEALDRKDAA
jgi:hypothetical protein